ncbi:MAG: hypothetical protein ABI072_06835 [Edaphobacter sp.]
MVSAQTNADVAQEAPAAAATSLLVSLTPLPHEALEATLANLALAFPSQPVLVATPDPVPDISSGSPFRLLPYTPATSSTSAWVLTAADYLNTYKLAEEHQATACLILGAESQSLHPEAIRALAAATLTSDLAVAHYNLGPREGLINSALLYPITRALFSPCPRFPLAIDLGLSLSMASRLATVAQKFVAANQPDALLWPVAEAAIGNCSVTEVDIATRSFPQSAIPDLNSLLVQIVGSLFAEVDAKASFWQRSRSTQTSRALPPEVFSPDGPPDIAPMLEVFQIACTNLQEIWALVLPPNALLGIKKLSLMHPDSFRMPDSLWTRIVYDFVLAYRLRTINRGHLLGALTPLYLAWVASHLLLATNEIPPERHIEEQAVAFETNKPYLVSRWRWPDRFNP